MEVDNKNDINGSQINTGRCNNKKELYTGELVTGRIARITQIAPRVTYGIISSCTGAVMSTRCQATICPFR